MSVRHVLAPGGQETCCGWCLDELDKGHSAGHRMTGRICQSCRARLRAFPQLVAAIAAELRASGHNPGVERLVLTPAKTRRKRACTSTASPSVDR